MPTMNSLTHLTFQGNEAQEGSGGAIFIESVKEKIIMKDCQFLKNDAQISGGAIYGLQLIDSDFSDLILEENKASQLGGAIYLENKCEKISIWNLKIHKNSA